MRTKVHLRKILDKQIDLNVFAKNFPDTFLAILKAMKDACDQTVDLCAENASWECSSDTIIVRGDISIDKKSILNTKEQIK